MATQRQSQILADAQRRIALLQVRSQLIVLSRCFDCLLCGKREFPQELASVHEHASEASDVLLCVT